MRKKWLALFVALLCLVMAFAMVGCGKGKSKETPEDFVNGGFETGDLTGWTSTGTAFGKYGVSTDSKVGVVTVGKVGDYWFNGSALNAQFTGTITSDPVKLTGTGKVAFMLSAGKSADKCYVEFFVEGSDTAVYKTGNTDFRIPFVTDQLVRRVVDLSEHLGKNIYVKITDEDKGDADEYAYIGFDDFKVLKTDADVAAAEAERKAILDEIGAPSFEEDETETAIRNGGFEDGLTNWLILEGEAFSKRCVEDSTTKFFGTREYNAVGSKFLNGYGSGSEAATGSMRSAKFTLAGDGMVSMLVGGAKTKNSYVALCGADGEELYKVFPSDHFKDPELSLNLARVYIDASAHLGEVMYVKIVDNDSRTGAFASLNVDDISVSLTEADTKALMRETYEWAMSLPQDAVNNYIRNYYETYDYPYALDVLRVKTKAVSRAINAADSVDLTAYIADVAGEYGDVPASDITKGIESVTYGETVTTTGFETFDMSEAGVYTVTYYVEYNDMRAKEIFVVDAAAEGQVLNGGFETGNCAGWTLDVTSEGGYAGASEAKVFWEGDPNFKDQNGQTVQLYHQDGKYFALTDDPALMTLKSTTFTLGGHGIISFKLGAKGVVKLVDAADHKVLLTVDNANLTFADPTMAQSMQRVFLNASAFIGKNCYIVVEDDKSSGVGLVAFDSLKVSLTYDEATAILTADKAWAASYRADVLESDAEMGGQAKNIVKAQHDYYENLVITDPRVLTITQKISNKAGFAGRAVDLTAYLSELKGFKLGVEEASLTKAIVKVELAGEVVSESGFDAFTPSTEGAYTVSYTLSDGESTVTETFVLTVTTAYQLLNGGFETGDLTGWTFTDETDPAFILPSQAVYNGESFWNERMPFNKAGNFFFCGMNDNLGTAFIPEAHVWHLTSSRFTLGGSGFISFKMGGRTAVVKVFLADGTQVAEFNNTKFKDENFPYLELGARYATMTTFVADLSAHLGQEMYIELHDTGTSGWGVATFDDIVTYYETAPDVANLADTVKVYARVQTGTNDKGEPTYGQAAEASDFDIKWETAVNTYVPAP